MPTDVPSSPYFEEIRKDVAYYRYLPFESHSGRWALNDGFIIPQWDESVVETRARKFANKCHWGMLRRYTNAPYITHCAMVAHLVRCVPHSGEMLAAAWLHDVVEDCGVTAKELEHVVGPEVRRMVERLSDVAVPADGNRRVRMAMNMIHSAGALADTQTVKMADILDTLKTELTYNPAGLNTSLGSAVPGTRNATVYGRSVRELWQSLTAADSVLRAEVHKLLNLSGH